MIYVVFYCFEYLVDILVVWIVVFGDYKFVDMIVGVEKFVEFGCLIEVEVIVVL